MHRAFLSATLFVLGAMPVAAQNSISSGAIAGVVRDASGSLVPDAVVTVTSDETALRFEDLTNSSGLFSFPVMKVGHYTLRVQREHFKTSEVRNVIVQVGQVATVDFQLAIGSLSQQLVVDAPAPLFRPGETSVSTVIPRELIEALPLSGRRYTDFVLL